MILYILQYENIHYIHRLGQVHYCYNVNLNIVDAIVRLKLALAAWMTKVGAILGG